MYGYTMAPDTIPREYYGWIVKTGRIPHKIIDFNRKHVRALESGNVVPDLSAMESLITKFGGTRDVVEKMRNDIGGRLGSEIPMPIVPCTVIHPHEMSCITQNVTLALKVFRDIFPVNCSLNIVPLIVFRGQAFVKR